VTWPVLQLAAAAAVVSLLFVGLHLLETRVAGLVAPDLFLLGLSPLENLTLFWAVLLGAGLSLFLIAKGVASGWFGSLPLRATMMIPLVGGTIKELALSRFAWAFGAAVDSGMSAVQAVRLGLSSTRNRYYESHERRIAAALGSPDIRTRVAPGRLRGWRPVREEARWPGGMS
jgi:type II secretory pathway component PulF